ncbi:tRNA (adenosine(37)-N6)-threonylcarbamoyltransferase complex ATPase subunit type 1 TsaE [Microlunatus sp. GCM10028923]|uniref:tRNA (adenosine(37)-N6)-threonylcarbamoyltransferase complex ATPase subunit type 1 TsaE n=1 Tax=Microlunatus sp. GCM10028923 TaxID=3273400 RepID=UPI00361442BF
MNASVPELELRLADPEDAAGMVEVIHAAFGARPPLDPPSTAIDETPATVAETLGRGVGVYATVAQKPAGVILIGGSAGHRASLQRVSVHPAFQRHGVASAMVRAAEELAAAEGHTEVELFARAEFPELIEFWQHRGYRVDREAPHGVYLVKLLPVVIMVPDADAMHALGRRLAELLEPGDVIIATGELGAGKTTLTQGIGQGLDSQGPIISPTFVISRIHPSGSGRPDLVHVDAYRIGGEDELDDLDLDSRVAESVTLVEWGEGLAERLSTDRLEIGIHRPPGTDTRTVVLRGVGPRWDAADLTALREGATDAH